MRAGRGLSAITLGPTPGSTTTPSFFQIRRISAFLAAPQRPEPASPGANLPRSTEAHPRLTRMQRRLCCSCRVRLGRRAGGQDSATTGMGGRVVGWVGGWAGPAGRWACFSLGRRASRSGATRFEGCRCTALSLLMAVSLRHRRRRPHASSPLKLDFSAGARPGRHEAEAPAAQEQLRRPSLRSGISPSVTVPIGRT
jgi:hypothetical protein